MKKIVIIGGCAAGPKAASMAKRINPENIVELYTKENVVSYSACGMPYYIGGDVKNINNLIVRTKEEFNKQGISVFLNHNCIKIDPDSKTVHFENGHKTNYDELILCVGSHTFIPNIKNYNVANVHTLKVLKDGIAIKRLSTVSKSVLLIGGGYIALELMEAFLKNDLHIYCVEHNASVLSQLDSDISRVIQNQIMDRAQGKIEFIFEDEVQEFLGENTFKGAITKRGREILADFCVIATGVKPNNQLARETGIEIGFTGGIKVNNLMQTSIPHIYAAGDCTEDTFIPTKQSVYLALGTIANKQGRVAAINVNSDYTGVVEKFDGILGSMVTKFFDFSIACTGISETKAKELQKYINIDPISATVNEYDKAGYMPNIGYITVKLIADRRTGEILGCEAIGTGDADKPVSIVASALRAHLSITEFLHLDLPYAPPFSSTIDPLLTAAYKLKHLIDK